MICFYRDLELSKLGLARLHEAGGRLGVTIRGEIRFSSGLTQFVDTSVQGPVDLVHHIKHHNFRFPGPED